MIPILLATSSASLSAERRTNAFFLPSGLHDQKSQGTRTPNESADLDDLGIIQGAHSGGDLTLGGGQGDKENESVVVLDLLHGALSGEGELDDGVLVQGAILRNGRAGILGRTSKLQSLGKVEARRGKDLASLVDLLALLHGRGGLLGLQYSLTLCCDVSEQNLPKKEPKQPSTQYIVWVTLYSHEQHHNMFRKTRNCHDYEDQYLQALRRWVCFNKFGHHKC
jgi:hypothetical protein